MNYFVNADDFGLNQYRNEAVVYSFQKGISSKTSLIINSEFTEEAVELSKKYDFFDKVGLHINITEGIPLTVGLKEIRSYCNEDSTFVNTSPRSLLKVFSLSHIKVLRSEIEAQIKKYLDYGFTLPYIDTHNDIIFNLPVWYALEPLLLKYDISVIRGIEPYLFGYYRKSILSYLPLKYYFMMRYFKKKANKTKIIGGGRNINQFVCDMENSRTKRIGDINKLKLIEIIIHPDFDGKKYIDRTNFLKNNNTLIYNTLADTAMKISRFEMNKIECADICSYLY
ncbi:ChbG/HpnK family deacetylase [Bacteroides sp.]|uniref:ChbG/HpnK family deacetylase n=1 Tax=Bacteroides sp. TaxID=29523 RepID=UPI002625BFC7|nr:ChbG/HpnK family deacetylase [Bacteroides sp.]MDD3037982.1 ChbG/HpnK family deacetylase [Bacteroides sp.]